MQRMLQSTFFFILTVVVALAAFAYGAFLCLFCPFRDGDVLGAAIAIIAAILGIPWIEHRRLQRKAARAHGHH